MVQSVIMSRNQVHYAAILKASRIGEIHKGLTLFTAGRGLLSCIAHGAWKEKSKLRSATQLFSYGKFNLYFNPVKNSCKVTDIQILELFEGIREDIHRYFAASLWAEIILKSYGGGESAPGFFRLYLASMQQLKDLAPAELDFLQIQFLWRFLLLSGVKPELGDCSQCGEKIPTGDSLYFQPRDAQFACKECARTTAEPVFPGVRMYLEKSLALPLEQGMRLKTEKMAIERLKKITYHILEVLLELQLKSLKSGEGII